jgi:hypothetical protein
VGNPVAITGTINNPTNKFCIGRFGENASSPLSGNIDEFVFVKGQPMNSTNFTPPTAPYGLQAVASQSITLPTSASASTTTDFYKDDILVVTSGTGAGQTRRITSYNGTTKVATLDQAWTTNPTTASGFALYDGITSNISPGYDFSQIDYTVYPTINVLCSLERQTGATASPSMGVPVVTSIEYNTVQRGTGTVALVASQATVNITLSKAVSVNGSRVKAWAKSTSATAYTADIVPILTSETNLQLKLSGSNATTPTEYAWEVEQI